MKNLGKKKLLIIIASVVGGIALAFGIIRLVYSIQCNKITAQERAAMRICKEAEEDFSSIKYANLLKKNNNGYTDYYYYDVVTTNGQHYIVELRDSGKYIEFNVMYSYKNYINMYVKLNDIILLRESDLGSFSDRVDAIIDKMEDQRS